MNLMKIINTTFLICKTVIGICQFYEENRCKKISMNFKTVKCTYCAHTLKITKLGSIFEIFP